MRKRNIKNYTSLDETSNTTLDKIDDIDNTAIINVKPNVKILHPIISTMMNTKVFDHDICLTKYYYDNKKEKFTIFKKSNCSNVDNYNKYLYIPPIGISSKSILQIYNISTIESLYDWIDNSFDNILTINRLINCWIHANWEIVKDHNAFLIPLCIKILIKFGLK